MDVMNLRFNPRRLEQVQTFLKSLPRGSLRTGLRGLSDYLVGDTNHGLRHYEPYKYVKPFRSYSFDPAKAAKQRAWIFAHLDIIGKNNRTGTTAAGWSIRETKGGYGISIENKEPGAGWLWSDANQTRQHKAVGHRTLSSKIASNLAGAIRHAVAEVRKWIKENKPKG